MSCINIKIGSKIKEKKVVEAFTRRLAVDKEFPIIQQVINIKDKYRYFSNFNLMREYSGFERLKAVSVITAIRPQDFNKFYDKNLDPKIINAIQIQDLKIIAEDILSYLQETVGFVEDSIDLDFVDELESVEFMQVFPYNSLFHNNKTFIEGRTREGIKIDVKLFSGLLSNSPQPVVADKMIYVPRFVRKDTEHGMMDSSFLGIAFHLKLEE